MKPHIFTSKEVTESRVEECDVCIIGSGAGGATVAANLVAAGKSVVMLEAGPYFTRKDFALHEAAAFQNLYQERGTRATDDQAITIMQGRNVVVAPRLIGPAAFGFLNAFCLYGGIVLISKS